MPIFLKPSDTACSRSDSFTLNSAASHINVSPSANAAAIDKIGISSMMFGIISPDNCTPFNFDFLTTKSAHGSPDSSL